MPTPDEIKDFAFVIPLTRGKTTSVSPEDYNSLIRFKWQAAKGHRPHDNNWHARRCSSRRDGQKAIFMHQFLMGAVGRHSVDHKNGDGLDNRRENLRYATGALNAANRRKRHTSLYKGVRRQSRATATTPRPWISTIGQDGKEIYLGSFATPEEAARAYDAGARERFGEFACVNFPESDRERQA